MAGILDRFRLAISENWIMLQCDSNFEFASRAITSPKISSRSNQKAICQMIFVGKAIAMRKQMKVSAKLSRFLHR